MKNVFKILLIISIFALFVSACTPSEESSNLQSSDMSDDSMSTSDSDSSEATSQSDMSSSEPVSDDTMISYQDISPAQAKELIENTPDLIIIDVSPNYDEGHLPGAVNYYLGDGSLDEAIPDLDKTKTYLVYCHVDSVAIQGAQKLIDAGFTNVYRLEGNYAAWVAAGYDIEY